mmetsp:Transcript_18535/g.27488  ORF Transcript_18535/g.27488 Transcript_18535/m.27488 type:complete len:288 (+) Transcript_18535:82-945(+)
MTENQEGNKSNKSAGETDPDSKAEGLVADADPSTIEQFENLHNKVIVQVKTATEYIQEDKDKVKTKAKIQETNDGIKAHNKFIKKKSKELRAHVKELSATTRDYEREREIYKERRNVLIIDEEFQKMLGKALKKRTSVVTSLKKIAKRKGLRRFWNPHTEDYEPNPDKDFADELDTLLKANIDLPRLEQEVRGSVDLPKRQGPIAQEYNDLVEKTNEMIETTDTAIEKRSTVLNIFLATVNGEVVDPKNEKQEADTEYKKALSDYEEIRNKVAPLVEEEQSTNCICM